MFNIDIQKELEVKTFKWVNKREKNLREIQNLQTSLTNEQINIANSLNLKVETIEKLSNYEFERNYFNNYQELLKIHQSLIIPKHIMESFAQKYALKIIDFEKYRGKVSEDLIEKLDLIIKKNNFSIFNYKSKLFMLIPNLHLQNGWDYESSLFIQINDYYIQVYESKKELNILRTVYSLLWRNMVMPFAYCFLILTTISYFWVGISFGFFMSIIAILFVSGMFTSAFKNFNFPDEVIIK
jgi:hypothetical protein